MKVVVLGATGFIGNPVANAFVRAGHIVYGQTRSASSANGLARDEIIPLVLDHTTEEGWKKLSSLITTVDVVVDAVPAMGPDVPLKLFKQFEALLASRGPGSKATWIYTGGSWVHSRGEGGLESWTDERQPYSGRILLTKWRWEVEKEVLASEKVNGIVIRPGILYGRGASLLGAMVFQPALEAAKKGEKFTITANPNVRFATIHQDDLADLYVRVGERAPICRGQAFVAVNPQSERLTDIIDATVRVSKAPGYTLKDPNPDSAWEQAAGNSTTNLKPTLGHALTGWVRTKESVVDGIDIYWSAFLASLEKPGDVSTAAQPFEHV